MGVGKIIGAGLIGGVVGGHIASKKMRKEFVNAVNTGEVKVTKLGHENLSKAHLKLTPKGFEKDNHFYGHSKVECPNIVKNDMQPSHKLGKDSFYRNVKNPIGKS